MRLTLSSFAQRRRRADADTSNGRLFRGVVREETVNPDDSPLPPAAQESQVLPSSSTASSSTASPTKPAFKPTGLSTEATVGIVIIIALVLVFSLAGIAVIFGFRGERCCYKRRRARKEAKRETLVRFNVSENSLPMKESREILIPPQARTP